MDDWADLLGRARQARRLAATTADSETSCTLSAYATELEKQAAAVVSGQLAGPDPFVISRISEGWMISLGGDRLAVRATLPEARSQAMSLAGLADKGD